MITILIISSEQNPAQTLRQILETNGYRADVQTVNFEKKPSSGGQWNADLILLDLSKSHWKVPELCRAVRNENSAPLVVLSYGESPEIVANVLDAGADDYLAKPVSNQMLFASINKLTRRSVNNQKVIPLTSTFD